MKQFQIIKSGVGLACLLFFFSSCEKKLDIDNPNRTTTDVFWTNQDGALKGVTAIYANYVKPGAMTRWIYFNLDLRSDEGTSFSPWIELQNWPKFIHTNYNFDPCARTVWQDHYKGIYRANQAITNIPNITMDETLKKRLIAEAKFLRGHYYFNLASMWGNVPIVTMPNDVLAEVPYSTEAQVWAQIQKDFTEAAADLPASYNNSLNNEIGRPTKGAAFAFLGKTLLQQKKYAEAKAAFDWLVTGAGNVYYDLVPNYADNFRHTTENNKESVYEIQFSDKIAGPPTEGEDFADHTLGNNRAQFFAPLGVGWSDGNANRQLLRDFNAERTTTNTRDPRIPVTFLYDSTDERGPDFTMVYGRTFRNRFPALPPIRFWFHKYQNDYWRDFENYHSPINIRVIRYADVLLMYAECLNELGQTATAYQYVDRVRARSNMRTLAVAYPTIGNDKAQFLARLKTERLLELCGESTRWNDLKRWGDLSTALSFRDPDFANFVTGKHELLPIPQYEIDINPNLKQNPNY